VKDSDFNDIQEKLNNKSILNTILGYKKKCINQDNTMQRKKTSKMNNEIKTSWKKELKMTSEETNRQQKPRSQQISQLLNFR